MAQEKDAVDRIHEKRTRMQVKQDFQKQKSNERAESIALTRANYLAEKDNPVVLDILTKAKNFAAYHTGISKDGVGYRAPRPGAEPEVYHLTSENRLRELDKASGIEELIDYIERQFKDLPEAVKPQIEADDEPLEPAGDDDMVSTTA